MPIEYILLGVGIVLLGIEAVVPGFGFFGVTGLISLLAGSYYLLGGGAEAAYILLGVVLALGAVVALLFVYLPAESKWNPFLCFMGETREPSRLYRCRGSRAVSW